MAGIFNQSIFNDGIFNTGSQGGLTIQGSHATPSLYGKSKYHPELLIQVEFTMRLIARTFVPLQLEQLNFTNLRPPTMNTESFSISLANLKEAWVKALKKQSLHHMMETILLRSDKVNLLRILKELYKR